MAAKAKVVRNRYHALISRCVELAGVNFDYAASTIFRYASLNQTISVRQQVVPAGNALEDTFGAW